MALSTLGNSDAPIYVVCEPPQHGWNPDNPTTVASLKLFLKEATANGFKQTDFFFIQLCEPIPENIKKSKAKTWRHVEPNVAEIRALLEGKDKAIVTMGDLATRAVVGRACAITKVRGTLLEGKVYPILPPAYCRVILEQMPVFKSDIVTLKKLYDNDFDLDRLGNNDKLNRYWCTDLSEILAMKPKLVAIDTETTGLRATAADFQVLTVQIAYSDTDVAVCPLHPNFWPGEWDQEQRDKLLAQIKELCEDKTIRKVGQNINFERHALDAIGIELNGVLADTQIMAWFVDENMMTKTLDDLVRRFVPHLAGLNDQLNIELDKSNMITQPADKVLIYSGNDGIMTYQLFWVLWGLIKSNPDQLRLFLKLKIPGLYGFFVMEKQGVTVDLDYLEQIGIELADDLVKRNKELLDMVPKAVIRKHLEAKKELKFSRADFVRDILFSKEGFGLEPVVFTASTKDGDKADRVPSTSAKDHLPYFTDAPGVAGDFVEAFMEFAKLSKLSSTYVKGFAEKYVHEDGKIHPKFNLHITVTGRSSSSGPNAQNFPSRGLWAKKYKKILKAAPGYKFISADLSQIELRLIAWESRDPVMLQVYREDKDIHTITAQAVTGINGAAWNALTKAEKKDYRTRAKAINFGFCAIGSTIVLTDNGLKRIVDVSTTDLLWDGHEWVSHEGVVHMGKKKVITYDGITLTPDHKVYVSDTESVTFEYAAQNKLRILRTGNGSQPLTVERPNRSVQSSEKTTTKLDLHLTSLHTLQQVNLPRHSYFTKTPGNGVQVQGLRQVARRSKGGHVSWPVRYNGSTMREGFSCNFSPLQGQGNQSAVQVESRICGLGAQYVSECGFQEAGLRQREQQWTLRAEQSSVSYPLREPEKQGRNLICRVEGREDIANRLDSKVFPLCRATYLYTVSRWDEFGADRRTSNQYGSPSFGQVENCMGATTGEATRRGVEDCASSSEVIYHEDPVDVYDIVNAGPRHRFTADNLLVSNCYGMRSAKFKRFAKTDYKIDLTDDEAEHYYQTYHKLYKNIKKWHSDRIYEASNLGYVKSLHGAVRHVPSVFSENKFIRSQAERQAINSPIQSFGSDLGLLGIARLARQVDPDLIRPAMFIHDDVILEVKDGYEEEAVNALLWVLNNPPLEQLFGITSPIPIKAEPDIGLDLGDMYELYDLPDELPDWMPTLNINPVKPSWWNDEKDLF